MPICNTCTAHVRRLWSSLLLLQRIRTSPWMLKVFLEATQAFHLKELEFHLVSSCAVRVHFGDHHLQEGGGNKTQHSLITAERTETWMSSGECWLGGWTRLCLIFSWTEQTKDIDLTSWACSLRSVINRLSVCDGLYMDVWERSKAGQVWISILLQPKQQ